MQGKDCAVIVFDVPILGPIVVVTDVIDICIFVVRFCFMHDRFSF